LESQPPLRVFDLSEDETVQYYSSRKRAMQFVSSGPDMEKGNVTTNELFLEFIKAIKEISNISLLAIGAITLRFTVRRRTA